MSKETRRKTRVAPVAAVAAKAAASGAQKRGRGRPRKNAANAEGKKRGRPRKNAVNVQAEDPPSLPSSPPSSPPSPLRGTGDVCLVKQNEMTEPLIGDVFDTIDRPLPMTIEGYNNTVSELESNASTVSIYYYGSEDEASTDSEDEASTDSEDEISEEEASDASNISFGIL